MEWCDQSDLLRVYDEHGIFLFPSFFEGFGKAFLEAMSRGLVVVASNNGGMKDVIKDGESGFLAKTGDWRQMADLAIQAVENPELAIEYFQGSAKGVARLQLAKGCYRDHVLLRVAHQ